MAWVKGKSGNPKGRRKGVPTKRIGLFYSESEVLQRKLLNMAKRGDMDAMKIIADRIWPRVRTQSPSPELDTEGTLHRQAERVCEAAMRGEVSVEAARDLVSVLMSVAQIREFTEFEQRLRTLEGVKENPVPWEKEIPPERVKPIKRRGKDETEY